MAGTRLKIVATFMLFMLTIAPFAWWLMQVQRANLPHDTIIHLFNEYVNPASARKISKSWRTQTISLWYQDANHQQQDKGNHDHLLRKSEYSDLHWIFQTRERVIAKADDGNERLDILLSQEYGDDPITSFHIFFLCGKQYDIEKANKLFVGTTRHAWTWACSMNQIPGLLQAVERLISQYIIADELSHQKAQTAKIAHRYRLDFTLLKQDGRDLGHWNLPHLIARYLDPVLSKLSLLAEFTIEQHVIPYATIVKGVTPAFDGHSHILRPEDLKNFKSANDFLTSSVLEDREQKLHFLAMLPSEKQHPLVIQEDNKRDAAHASSFEIPGWGTVVILDRQHVLQGNAKDTETEYRRMMSLFVTNLRHLMGFPNFYQRQQEENRIGASIKDAVTIQFLPAKRTALCDWEMDKVMRRLLHRHTSGAIITLHSVSVLLSEMPQMSVSQRIQELISLSLEELNTMICNATEHDIATVLQHARRASALADTAYYDPSLIRQLYFPHDQLFGVYAPLLAPLILPVVFGFFRELKRYKAKVNAQKFN